jgi:glutamate-ammonia-ligase adenylyltransferase
MRALMERERPPSGFWDLKLSPGGLVDAEFAAQFLQIACAPDGGPLRTGTLDALEALAAGGYAPKTLTDPIAAAWRLHQDLAQLLRAALDSRADPAAEPEPFQRRLARAGGVDSLDALAARLDRVRREARAAFEALIR